MILAILLLVIGLGLGYFSKGLTVKPGQFDLPKLLSRIKIGLLILAGFSLLFSIIVQVNSGTVGVQRVFGKTHSSILTPGINFINPLADVVEFDTKTQNYTMSATHDEGDKQGDDAIRVLSSDGLEVVIDLTVLYRVEPIKTPMILNTIGTDYKNVIIRPLTRTEVRNFASEYDAMALYSTKRPEFQAKVIKKLAEVLKAKGLILENVLLRNINLPESVKKTIESKINAEQEAQKMQYVLQKEKQEAERKRVEAQGIADYQRIVQNELTDKSLRYEQIKATKELASSPNAKIIIMPSANTPVILGNQ